MELILYSKKYGTHTVYCDDEDAELIMPYTWSLFKGRGDMFYVRGYIGKKKGGAGQKEKIRMHRLILGADPDQIIDHVDHNGKNNRRSNLRIATSSQNGANKRISIDNTTGFKGVTFKKSKKLFLARIRVSDELIYGGSFKCPLDAAKRYNEMALKYFGEFACLNNITQEMENHYASNRPPIRRTGSSNKSGFIGVSVTKYNKKRPFVATLSIDRKNVYLGNYETAIEAARAYNEAVVKYNKPLHYLNKIPE